MTLMACKQIAVRSLFANFLPASECTIPKAAHFGVLRWQFCDVAVYAAKQGSSEPYYAQVIAEMCQQNGQSDTPTHSASISCSCITAFMF
jgi:hypothetical protein